MKIKNIYVIPELIIAFIFAITSLPLSVSAAGLIYSVDTTVALTSPALNLTILSGSEADSLAVGTGSVTVTVAAGDSFSITSATSNLVTSGASNSEVLTQTCSNAALKTITVAPISTTETVTITPTGTPCSSGSGGSSSSSGGSSSGGSGSVPPPTNPPVAPPQGQPHAVGQNVNDSGTIYMIRTGPCKAAYTSAGAFLSYGFNSWATVVLANAADVALPKCAPEFIPPSPGSIIFSDRGTDKGTGYFITLTETGVQKRGFTSAKVFLGLGYKFERGTVADVSWMTTGPNIDSTTQPHPAGSLINKSGTISIVGLTGLIGIPSQEVFFGWGMTFANTVPANTADSGLTQTSVLQAREPGQLFPGL